MTTNDNEIVVYEPDETIRLDVRLDDDTVWLTQNQMTDLFQRDRTVITRHINNVFSEGELDEEEVMMDAMDAGADDFEADGDVFTIYTLPDDFNDVVANLGKYTFVSAQIEMVPQNYQGLNDEQAVMMQKLIDAMEDDDDVQNVWHNWEE